MHASARSRRRLVLTQTQSCELLLNGVLVGLPAAEWMVRIGAPLVIRTDPELALYGRYVVSTQLAEMDFPFHFAELEAALRDLYTRA